MPLSALRKDFRMKWIITRCDTVAGIYFHPFSLCLSVQQYEKTWRQHLQQVGIQDESITTKQDVDVNLNMSL